jgi:ABC-type nitrate/sulfonate/bicarbonate transport system substrate-binding protein
MIDVSIGYLPLTDAATLIAAAEFGFASDEGLRLSLQREVSWATLRDRLVVGHVDAAHMLAPLAVATSLGLGQLRRELKAVFVLNANGNAVTISPELARDMGAAQDGALASAAAAAKALGAVVTARRAAGAPALTFASTYPFSSHTLLLRKFMALGGVDPDRDVEIVVVPPPYMIDCIDKGLIDGFCVGSPWNSLAVAQRKGVIAALGSEIVPEAIEKVLATTAGSELFLSGAGERLMRALQRAALFVDDKANRDDVAQALSRRLSIPVDVVKRSLSGELVMDGEGRRRIAPGFLRFSGGGLNRPDPAAGETLCAEMAAAGQAPLNEQTRSAARAVFDPALYDRAFG